MQVVEVQELVVPVQGGLMRVDAADVAIQVEAVPEIVVPWLGQELARLAMLLLLLLCGLEDAGSLCWLLVIGCRWLAGDRKSLHAVLWALRLVGRRGEREREQLEESSERAG